MGKCDCVKCSTGHWGNAQCKYYIIDSVYASASFNNLESWVATFSLIDACGCNDNSEAVDYEIKLADGMGGMAKEIVESGILVRKHAAKDFFDYLQEHGEMDRDLFDSGLALSLSCICDDCMDDDWDK